ncbi:MAG: anthranilate synthase component I [Candidatus Omnitrophota bacterium]
MVSPDLKTFKKLFRKGDLVALTRSIPADLETPVSCFMKLASRSPQAFLLESAEQEEKIGRYSIIGLDPEAVLTEDAEGIRIARGGKKTVRVRGRPMLEHLKDEMAGCRVANPEVSQGFLGGMVGFFSYECVQDFESVRLRKKHGEKIPRAIFFLTRRFVIFDHFRKRMTIVNLVAKPERGEPGKAYAQAARWIDRAVGLLKNPVRVSRSGSESRARRFQRHTSRAAFAAKVRRIREYIKAGDCIQVVLSQKFSTRAPREDFSIYRALRSVNPSPYMFYFRSGPVRLIGSSPELLVKVHGRDCEVRPIAGTRPRGKDPRADGAFEENLKRSPKELAEHLMLVDLGRNDLGRVCDFKTVAVKNFARVERYSHVMHLVSDVAGRLARGKDRFDLLKATFPAGTVSGAPKIRAMQIIDELEEETRGPYAGCLGFLSYDNAMEMCITIRTIMVAGSRLCVQVGAGIVKDSNPAREYQETVNKAKALFKAIEQSGAFAC